MQHPDEGTIHSWLDGALSAEEAARVEAHVKECPECAAGVAEARGFIAGASRILTALDNAPRGVIPVAAPKKRIDPWVLRVAATVLVVAAGTLVVLRNGGKETSMATLRDTVRLTSKEVAPTAPTADEGVSVAAGSVSSAAVQPNSAGSAAGSRSEAGQLRRRDGSFEKSSAQSAAADALSDSGHNFAARAPEVTRPAEARAPAAAADSSTRQKETVTGQILGKVAGTTTPLQPSGYAGVDARTPQAPTPIRIRGVSDLSAGAQPPLKVVGTPRALGLKITLYEVAPGDTVTLTEPANVQLESVVVTGMSTAEPRAAQVTGKSVAAKSARRADTAGVSAADSERASANRAAPASAPPAIDPRVQVEVANGVTTLSWADATTGNVLKLSGRIPESRLQIIRVRIEMERAAAAAAAAAKKNP